METEVIKLSGSQKDMGVNTCVWQEAGRYKVYFLNIIRIFLEVGTGHVNRIGKYFVSLSKISIHSSIICFKIWDWVILANHVSSNWFVKSVDVFFLTSYCYCISTFFVHRYNGFCAVHCRNKFRNTGTDDEESEPVDHSTTRR